MPTAAAVAATLCLVALPARADGLSDLKSALGRLRGQQPLTASFEIAMWSRHGEGSGADEWRGRATLGVEHTPRGLELQYPAELLARVNAEADQVAHDPNTKTPARNTLRNVDAVDVQRMLSNAPALRHDVEDATFQGEAAADWHGHPARKLTFSMPIERLSNNDRKYVKHFDSRLELWIAPDGTPLGSHLHVSVKGRAFVVVGFEQEREVDRSYAVSGDRLVIVHEDEHNRSSGAGEQQETQITRSVKLGG
jgi:hypothetical protein